MIEDLDATQSQPQGGEPGILHVMFHGAFVFDFHDDHVDVLIPEVDGHVYRAGSWLGETELICGEHSDEDAGGHEEHGDQESAAHDHANQGRPEIFRLEGVECGRVTTLPLDHNLMLRANLRANVGRLLRARIRVPLPDRITTPRRGRLSKDDGFDHTEDLPEDYRGYVGTLQIFTYRFQNDNALRLACHPGHSLWEPAFAGDAITLHIIAAPEHFHVTPALNAGASHVQNAFQACMALFRRVDLVMKQLPETNEFDAADVPSGAVVEETEDLAPRIRRLSRLGRMKKDQRDLNLLWFASEAYDGDPDACSSNGNRGD